MNGKLSTTYKAILIIYIFIIIAVLSTTFLNEDSYVDSSMHDKNIMLIKDELSDFGKVISSVTDELNVEIKQAYATKEQLMKISMKEKNIYQSEEQYVTENNKNNYYPIAKKTVVFLINKDVVKEDINSWKDVKNSKHKVLSYWSNPHFILAESISEGSDESNIKPGGDYFLELRENDRFKRLCEYESERDNLINMDLINDIEIAILWDYQAAYIIKHINRNLVMTVPSDGTVETTMGLFSNASLDPLKRNFDSIVDYLNSESGKDILISNGYRTIDGQADRNVYPDESQYASAKSIENNEVWGNSIINYFNGSYEKSKRAKLIGVGLLIVIWTFFAIRKWPYRSTRKHMVIISILLILWLSIRLLKMLNTSVTISTLTWYMYYIPLLGILAAWTFACYEHRYRKKTPLHIRNIIIIISIIFSVLFITNNFHNYIYKIDMMEYKRYAKYDYNYGYYLLVIWATVLTIYNLYNSIRAIVVKDVASIFIYILGIIPLITFLFLYYFHIIRWDYTITTVLLILLFEELSIKTILYRQQHITHPFFKSSSTIFGIYDCNDDLVFISDSGEKLRNQIGEGFIEKFRKYIDNKTFIYKSETNNKYLGILKTIKNGYFLSLENIDLIISANNELKAQNVHLNSMKEYLSKEKDVLEELKRLEVGVGVLDTIERETENSLNMLKEYIREVYSGNDVRSYSDKIYITCRYIKQKAQLSVLAINRNMLDKKNVEIMIDELFSAIVNKEMDVFFTVVGNDNLSAKSFIVLKELIYSILIETYDLDSASMYARIVSGDDGITIMVNLDLNSNDMITFYSKLDQHRLRKKIVADLKVRNDADSMFISGFIPKGGRSNE